MARTVTRVEIEGPSGRIVGLLAQPEAEAAFIAVVSHPHPLFGGTMDDKVAYRVARALEAAGGTILRYNFRGAGGSEGQHDHGIGEQDDLRAALAFLRSMPSGLRSGPIGDLPVLLAGFSFGSVMSARVGVSDPSIAGILLVGSPVRNYSFEELAECRKPLAFVHGERDEHGPLDRLEALVASLHCPTRVVVVPKAGHFFDDEQDQLRDAVLGILASGHFGPAFAPEGAASDTESPC